MMSSHVQTIRDSRLASRLQLREFHGMTATQVSAALRLLIECTRPPIADIASDAIRESVAGIGAWDEFLQIASYHRVLPVVAARLRGCADLVPQEVQARMQELELVNAATALSITAELMTILRLLRARDILAVPYKGPVLSQQLYGHIASRVSGDLDLLVRRNDVGGASRALVEAGYTAVQPLRNGARAFMYRSRYSEPFVYAGRAPVELHWAFTNRDIAFPLELEDLVDHLDTLDCVGETVPVFASDDLLLILSVHGAKHRWERLEWICGFAAAVGAAPSLDWIRLVGRATEFGIRRMLLLGLLLADELMRAPVPAWVLDLARRDIAVARSASSVRVILASQKTVPEVDSLASDVFRYRLRERWRDRARFILYRATTPSQAERWRSVSIGRHAIPLHAFIRPFRLIVRGASVLRTRCIPAR